LPSSMPGNTSGALSRPSTTSSLRCSDPSRTQGVAPLEELARQVGGELGLDEPADGQALA
jgi:hypothetical protein